MIPESSPENHLSIDADDLIIDVALHHEIKFRAYELYERRHDTADGHDLKDKLQAELPTCGLRGSPASETLQGRGRGHQSRQSGSGLPSCSDLVYPSPYRITRPRVNSS
jgi:hypothetical protein